MEIILCKDHNKPCMLKTGVKEGPSFGQSFYICSCQPDRCNFVKKADSSLSLRNCDKHEGKHVELQTQHYNKTKNEKRQFYRCTEGKALKQSWCGFWVTEENVKKPAEPLKDKNGRGTENQKSAESTQPSKQMIKKPKSKERTNIEHVAKKTEHSETSSSEDSFDTERSGISKSKPVQQNDRKKPTEKKASASSSSTSSSSLDEHPSKKGKPKDSTSTSVRNYDKRKTEITSSSDSSSTEDNSPNVKTKLQNLSNITDFASLRKKGDQKTETGLPLTPGGFRNRKVSSSSSSDSSDDDDEEFQNGTRKKKIPLKNETKDSLPLTPGGYRAQKKSNNSSSDSSSESDEDCVIVEKASSQPTLSKPQTQSKPEIKIIPSSSSMLSSSSDSKPEIKIISSSSKQVITVNSVKDGVDKMSLGDHTSRPITKSEYLQKVSKRADMVRHLARQKDLFQRTKPTLPDGGVKFGGFIEALTADVTKLDLEIKRDHNALIKQSPDESKTSGASDGSSKLAPDGKSYQVVRTASGQILPGNAKQALMTDHMTQLPAHVLQEIYGAQSQAMRLYGGRMTTDRLKQVGEVTGDAIERLHKQLDTCPGSEVEEEDPENLKVSLMIHQRQALAWLIWREQQHPSGGILADDMGLGKTLTMISLILKLKKDTKVDKEELAQWKSKFGKSIVKSNATLVICPASLIHQWNTEIQRRCKTGLLKVLVYHGASRERVLEKVAHNDVVLTTYNIISKEVGVPEGMKKNKHVQDMPVQDQDPESNEGPKESLLMRIAWERIILDEAHAIKNHKSLTAMSTCRLRAKHRWALTGTPIQNDLLDMYALLRFLRCSPFDEFKVWKRQVDNKSTKGTQRLNTLVKSLLLRRTKDQTTSEGKKLVSLPPKTLTTHTLELAGDEKILYDKIHKESRATLQNYLQQHDEKERMKQSGQKPSNSNPWANNDINPGSSGSANPGFVQASQLQGAVSKPLLTQNNQSGGGQILLMLLRLRQCCGHMNLLKDGIDEEALETDGLELDIVEQMKDLAVNEEKKMEPTVKKSLDLFNVSSMSTKVVSIMKELKKIKKESDPKNPMKSVIVSQWTKMLDIMEYHLKNDGFKCCTIRGNIPPSKRMELVDAFNTDPKGPTVMLLSLRAGGVGLNLIGGNHLFMVDMHWNPALEAQACDRIYRVGQERNVYIHRFVCKDTVEESIQALQKRKMTLAKNILSGGGVTANKLTLEDLKMLFGLNTPSFDKAANYGNSVR